MCNDLSEGLCLLSGQNSCSGLAVIRRGLAGHSFRVFESVGYSGAVADEYHFEFGVGRMESRNKFEWICGCVFCKGVPELNFGD